MTRHYGPQTWDSTVFHSNSRYAADAACEHCEKLGGHHEVWCVTCNHRVLYARGVVEDAKTMTMQDNLILHALGVLWEVGAYREVRREPVTLIERGALPRVPSTL